MLAMSHLFDRFPGQTHRQEEEDVGEVLQLEPLLERIIRLPYRRDGHEASDARCHGSYIGILLTINEFLLKLHYPALTQTGACLNLKQYMIHQPPSTTSHFIELKFFMVAYGGWLTESFK